MRFKKPSAAMIVAIIALMSSLSGVGAAATGVFNFPRFVRHHIYLVSHTYSVPVNSERPVLYAYCHSYNDRLLTGGFSSTGPVHVYTSRPADNGNGDMFWMVTAEYNSNEYNSTAEQTVPPTYNANAAPTVTIWAECQRGDVH